MPSGYTHDLHDGKEVSFNEFVLTCARAFLGDMKEEPFDAPIREIEPSTYHADQLKEHEAELEVAKNWSDSEATRQAEVQFKRRQSEYEEAVARATARRARFEEMLAKVEAWQLPSEDHEGLKQFMIRQLKTSIEQECNVPNAPTRITGPALKQKRIEEAQREVDYHAKELTATIERVRERNTWVKTLVSDLEKSPDEQPVTA